MIRRGFVDIGDLQVHYRRAGAGDGVPLVLLHASPASSKQFERLIAQLAPGRPIIAPDRPGNGDSSPLDLAQPEIADYARSTVEVMDALGIAEADFYGSHTGASIAIETAIIAPERVRRVIADGVPVYDAEERAYMLANYAPAFPPELDGSHLLRAFIFCRDMFLFAPWFERTREARTETGLPNAQQLHDFVLDVLKVPTTYPLGYHAAFRYPMDARLPLVTRPLLAVASESDMLRDMTIALTDQNANAMFHSLPRYDDPEYSSKMIHAIESFLDE